MPFRMGMSMGIRKGLAMNLPDPLAVPIPRNVERRAVEASPPSSAVTQEVRVGCARAIPASAEIGNRRLRAYLGSHRVTRERFDQAQAREILADADADHRAANELAGDPAYERVQKRRGFEAWLIGEDE